jgi:hypothetical protein
MASSLAEDGPLMNGSFVRDFPVKEDPAPPLEAEKRPYQEPVIYLPRAMLIQDI